MKASGAGSRGGLDGVLDWMAACPALARKVAGRRGGWVLEHVHPAAQASVVALVGRTAPGRVWVVCRDLKQQESVHSELCNWFPEAQFFPELELSAVAGALPDPEVAAERLAIVEKLAAGGEGGMLVVTAAALDEAVSSAAALKKMEVRLDKGTAVDREALLEKLSSHGYESVGQVSARGQYAVRGGILDVFSYQEPLPVRLEFFGDEIESVRHFDLDQQTSVEQLEGCVLLLGDGSELGASGKTTGGKKKAEVPLRNYAATGDLWIDLTGEGGLGIKDAVPMR